VTPDAGAGSSETAPTDDTFAQLNSPAGCGCTTAGSSGGLDGLAMLALGGAATVLVRRRRR
jgi:MYXO-CTERM domain-containing protein